MTEQTYHEYTFRFPAAGLALALDALDALREIGVLEADRPANMLGERRDQAGAIVPSHAAWRGSRGSLAVTTPDGVIPAKGDPDWFYINVRSLTPPEALGDFDPADYGFVATTAEESAEVLGVWA